MKITYRIENFKAFSDSGALDFSPITVLCGVNSAGKSSIIKSILLARQSSTSRRSALSPSKAAHSLILNGEFTQLGSWSDTVTNHERGRVMRICWQVEANRSEYRDAIGRANLTSNEPKGRRIGRVQKLGLSVALSSDPNVAEELSIQTECWELDINGSKVDILKSDRVTGEGEALYSIKINNVQALLSREGAQIGRYSLYLGDTIKAVAAEKGELSLGNVVISSSGLFVGKLTAFFDDSWVAFFEALYEIVLRHRGVKRGPQPKWIVHLEGAVRNYRKSLEAGEQGLTRSPVLRSLTFLATELLEEISKAYAETKAIIAPMWRDIRYLGPLRDQPRRYYQFDDTGGADVGVSGEFTVQILALEKSRRLFSRQIKTVSPKGIEFTKPIDGDLLSHANHWLDFMGLPSVNPLSLEQSLYKLEVGHLAVGLLDVGFGVSQVLPIIVEALRAEPGDLVILEQPEIHLHPRVQAILADFLLARSLDGIRFLVESHSEYMIKRLCRRFAESDNDEIKASTSIYFVAGDSGQASCTRVRLNEFGEIENWPKGFFDLDEDLYWAKASLSKRKAKRALDHS